MALRFHNGRLQQQWTVTRYYDARLERNEGVVTREWRDVPSIPFGATPDDANG
jgi:hypothetical protein